MLRPEAPLKARKQTGRIPLSDKNAYEKGTGLKMLCAFFCIRYESDLLKEEERHAAVSASRAFALPINHHLPGPASLFPGSTRKRTLLRKMYTPPAAPVKTMWSRLQTARRVLTPQKYAFGRSGSQLISMRNGADRLRFAKRTALKNKAGTKTVSPPLPAFMQACSGTMLPPGQEP